jgi:hypothetical protein
MVRTANALLLTLGLMATTSIAANAQMYGGGYGLPQGSYQQSCSNEQMRGSTLSASCASVNGQPVWSSVNVRNCNSDIINANGHLACASYNNGNGYGNNGYGNNGYGYNNGRGRDRGRGNNGYNNGNGYGYGNGYGVPPGSWQQSCQNARMNGPMLSASCATPNGGWVNSSLDLRRCPQANNIYNRNGYLGC